MTKISEIENQIDDLKVEKLRIYRCQMAIGEYIFELLENGEIEDEKLNMELNRMINKINPSKHDLFSGYL